MTVVNVTPRVRQVREVTGQRLSHCVRARTHAAHPAAIEHVSSTLVLICSLKHPSLDALSMVSENVWWVCILRMGPKCVPVGGINYLGFRETWIPRYVKQDAFNRVLVTTFA